MAAILDLPEIRDRVHRWTVADYERLTEDDPAFRRSELIRGIIVEKTPKSPLHSFLTKRLYDFFLQHAHPDLLVRTEQPLRLEDSMPEPDVAVVRGTEGDFRAHHPATAELVVEVAVTSAAPDRQNAALYAEAGVAEYWIVLGEEERVEVYRLPEHGAYQTMRVYARHEMIEGVRVTNQPVLVETFFG